MTTLDLATMKIIIDVGQGIVWACIIIATVAAIAGSIKKLTR